MYGIYPSVKISLANRMLQSRPSLPYNRNAAPILQATIAAVARSAARIPASALAPAHFVLPYLLARMRLSTPPYSPL